jgi:hypothetical protein
MGVLKYINLKVFILSFIFGLFAMEIVMPERQTVFVYPTPENVNDLQYKDKVGNCFVPMQEDVDCAGKYEEIPMQK